MLVDLKAIKLKILGCSYLKGNVPKISEKDIGYKKFIKITSLRALNTILRIEKVLKFKGFWISTM